MEKIILWFLNFMTLYAFIPGILSRLFGYRVFKKGHTKREIALTFDDGPDEVYTEQLLDLLKLYDAKATFFLVGEHIEKNPALVLRMKEEGHTIGIHNYQHKTNWFMLPKTVKQQIEKTNELIFNITGQYTHYYRPPWGVVNLFDFARVKELNIVLWSGIFGDWQQKLGPEKLKNRMLKKLKPGAVFLLHDCGRTLGADSAAPENMLIALNEILHLGTKKGYSFVTIEKLQSISSKYLANKPSILKRAITAVWLQYEKLVRVLLRLKSVKRNNNTFFYYRLIKYSGKALTLSSGERINKGDLVVELHFDNAQLSSLAYQSKSMVSTAIRLVKEIERNLPYLALELKREEKYPQIKAVLGITMINKGSQYLGFEIFDLPPGVFAKLTKVYLKILMKALTPSQPKKKAKVTSKQEVVPKTVIMKKQNIEQWYSVYEQQNGLYVVDEVAVTK